MTSSHTQCSAGRRCRPGACQPQLLQRASLWAPLPAAGALPPWCGQLLRSARFLFPFEARRRFFYCTSFGLARALHYLQQVRGFALFISILVSVLLACMRCLPPASTARQASSDVLLQWMDGKRAGNYTLFWINGNPAGARQRARPRQCCRPRGGGQPAHRARAAPEGGERVHVFTSVKTGSILSLSSHVAAPSGLAGLPMPYAQPRQRLIDLLTLLPCRSASLAAACWTARPRCLSCTRGPRRSWRLSSSTKWAQVRWG